MRLALPLRCLAALAPLVAFACTSSNSNNNSGGATFDAGISPTDAGASSGDGAPAPDAATCNQAPPSGTITLAAAQVASAKAYGQETALALDENGDPLVAFSSGGSGGQLFFFRWDRCAGAFTTPVVVDAVGIAAREVDENQPAREVSIARDPKSGAIAIAYAKTFADNANPGQAIYVAKSTDKGATWKSEQLSVHPGDEAGDIHDALSPAVTFAQGKIWVAYTQSYVYCDGGFKDTGQPRCEGFLLDGDLGAWNRQVIVRGSNGHVSAGKPMGIDTDAAGNVGVAFVTEPETGYNRVVEFWRPGSKPVDVFDSANEQNDSPVVNLRFFGTKPRVAAHLVRDAKDTYDILYSQSDDGTTWSPFVTVPRDVTRDDGVSQSLAVGSKGQVAIAANDSGGTDATPKCGSPKIARSADGSTFDACGADTKPENGTSGDYVSAAYGPDDKLQLVFYNGDTESATHGVGVLYWREP